MVVPVPLGMVLVGIVVVEVPAWDIGCCIIVIGVCVIGWVEVVEAMGVFVEVSVSSSSSISMPAVGHNRGPSPCFRGTGLMLYHLFLLLTVMNTHR